MTPVLYSFRRCPYAMRARLALQAAAQTVELREVSLKAKPAHLLQVSPKATVPVLVLHDTVLEQSLDIMLWALRRHDPLHWLAATDHGLEQAQACIARNDGEFKYHLDRYKYPHRYGLESGLASRESGAVFLQELDATLRQQACLSGEAWGFTDAAIAPFVRQFAHTDPAWFAAQPWAALQQWLQAFEDSAAFNAVMQKFAPWNAGDAPLHTCFAV